MHVMLACMAPEGDVARWQQLRAVAERQHGLVTRAQAIGAGFSSSAVHTAARRGEWTLVRSGVYALPGAPLGPLQRVAAALLRNQDVAACGWTALWLWGLVSAPPSTVEVIVPHGRRGPCGERVAVRRSRTLLEEEVCERHGLRVVAPARAIVDLAACARPDALRRIAIDARQRRLLDVPTFATAVTRAGAVAGAPVLRRLVDELSDERADSILEHRARLRLREVGFDPHPEPFPVTVGGRTLSLDIAFPDRRVAIEVDGFRYHSTPDQLARDHARSNLLATTDWKVLRIGWREVEEDFDGVVDAVTRLLRSRGWPGPAALPPSGA